MLPFGAVRSVDISRFAAERARSLAPSPTVAVSESARAMASQGIEVVDLGGGDPDFITPEHVRRAAQEAMERGETHYVSSAGIPALRQAIAHKLRADNGVEVDPQEGVLVTPGGKAALFSAMLALVEPGVEVLLPEPAWVSYRSMIELAGGQVVPIPLRSEDGYRLTAEALRARLTPRTRLMVVNSPNNPTGRVLDEEELEAIATIAQEADLLVLSDEIYEKILYDQRRHQSIASRAGMGQRTLIVNGFSKAYAMTGWRLGYVAGPAPLVRPIARIHGHSATCATSFAQWGGLAALTGPHHFLEEMTAAWDRRRRLLCERLARVPGVRCPLPEGAFYAMADVRALGIPSVELAKRLLDEAKVAVTPGVAFGAAGEGHLRICFAAADEAIVRASERIARCLGTLPITQRVSTQ